MDSQGQSEIEATRRQEQQIEKEIADSIPYVTERFPVSALKDDYQQDDDIYQTKIYQLQRDYSWLRRTRPDGNCFFRAFSFSYLESMIGDKSEADRAIEVLKQSKEDLIKLGYPQFTIEDFYETFMDILKHLSEGKIDTQDKLLHVFYEQGTSDYVVVYLRLIASCYLQNNEAMFKEFILDYTTIQDFCKTEVEPMFKESDHIHVVAITSAMNIFTRIIYMDRATEDIQKHDFPESENTESTPRIHLLYRPGHYDVLYVKE